MDITFKDSKKQRKWTYNHVASIYADMNYIRIVGWNEIDELYSARHYYDEFDAVELDVKEEGD